MATDSRRFPTGAPAQRVVGTHTARSTQRLKANTELDALSEELAPLRVPEPVREFWRRVDVRTLRVQPFPGFCTPEFALKSWRETRDAFSAFQPLL